MRASIFALSVLVATAALAARSPAAKTPAKRRPAVELMALNTHEVYRLQPDPSGRLPLRGWSRFLRCHHTGRVHAMSGRLAQLLYETAQHFDYHRILVVAGYRAPRVAREKGNPKSPHKQGVACDFRVEGVANEQLRDFVRSFRRVGVGYYPNSDFVHLDVARKASAFWVDTAGPGERAHYATDPEGYLHPSNGSGGDAPQGDDDPGVVTPNPPAATALNPENN